MAYTTINKSSDYFNTKLYTGTGSSTSITGVGFQPDLVYTTSRSNSYNNGMFDSVRGVNKLLNSNTTNAEVSISNGISSFDSDGFTFSGDAYNTNAYTFASWNWLGANGTSANTDGTISSTVSANTTSGFSIVKWTGTNANATVGHGLGVAPKMIIIRRLESTSDWVVYHSSVGNTSRLVLNSTGAASANSTFFNNTSPTSTTFSVGSDGGSNGSTDNYIAYCFADVQGFSKFGSYTGNNNADGTFVYTGFKPAFLMVFAYTAGNENWIMVDNKRDGFNVENEQLFPNTNGVEESNDEVDLLSNGFKLRRANSRMNGSNYPYIYMAFAEAPLVGSNGVTAKAR